MTQTKVGWRAYVATTTTASTLLTSIYGVWNADTLGTSLDTSIYAAYNAENNANDSVGTNHGTLVNGTTFAAGKIGQAFNFDGVNDYVALPNNILKKTGDFSFSVWVNANVLSGNKSIFGTYFYDGTTYGWRLDFNDAGMNFGIFGSSQVNLGITGTFNTGQWYNIVVTRKASTGTKVYINGTLNVSNTSTINPNYATTQYTTIGATQYQPSTVTYYLNGKIDGISVWDKELTAAEVTNLYNAGTGAEYPFSSQLLPSPNDSVSANHGTLMNGATFTTGKIGQAFTFDGVNDYVALPNNSLNSLTSDFSVSGWLYMPANTSDLYCVLLSNVSNDYTTGKGWSIFTYGNNIYFDVYYSGVYQNPNSAYIRLQANNTLTNNAWNHIAIARKNSTSSKIYINGSLVGSNTSALNPATPTDAITPTIGVLSSVGVGNPLSSYAPNGTKIDALSVWNKELSAAEITELYNSGTGKQYPNY